MSMETFILQYGLEMIKKIVEGYTDEAELEKPEGDFETNAPYVVSASATETGPRRRGLGKKTVEKMDQEVEARKFAELK